MNSPGMEQFSSLHLGHLGLVSDKIDDLDLISLIDQRLPISEAHGAKVTHGERVAAMILNGLGFIDSRLYLFPEFLSDKSVDRLFERDVKAAYFNDDALGRCLDEISAYGSTKLFSELSLLIGDKKGLLGDSVHLDTTTLSLFGEYDEGAGTSDGPRPERGYAKSGRHDLKQMILLLATTGAASFPVWMEAHSGNASDQITLPNAAERMRALCQNLSTSAEFIYVGDSAIYSNILKQSDALKWITRVPERIKEANELVSTKESELSWTDMDNGYKYVEVQSNYKEVSQRWVMIFSEAAYLRESKTLDKNLKKQEKEQNQAWWHLSNRTFTCKDDAVAAMDEQKKQLKHHKVTTEVIEVKKHKSRGRPKADEVPEVIGYQVQYELSPDAEKIECSRRRKGRFILATNQIDKDVLSSESVLTEYKAQSGTERGFKFIKDNTFQVDSVFLKTPERIEALMMVMTLCLMVYGVSEFDLHQSLKASGETILNQVKKPTDRPSLRWVYFLFRVINELHIKVGDHTQRCIINLTAPLKGILRHFGERARSIYLNPA